MTTETPTPTPRVGSPLKTRYEANQVIMEEMFSEKLQKEEELSQQLGKLYILQGMIENKIYLNDLDKPK